MEGQGFARARSVIPLVCPSSTCRHPDRTSATWISPLVVDTARAFGKVRSASVGVLVEGEGEGEEEEKEEEEREEEEEEETEEEEEEEAAAPAAAEGRIAITAAPTSPTTRRLRMGEVEREDVPAQANAGGEGQLLPRELKLPSLTRRGMVEPPSPSSPKLLLKLLAKDSPRPLPPLLKLKGMGSSASMGPASLRLATLETCAVSAPPPPPPLPPTPPPLPLVSHVASPTKPERKCSREMWCTQLPQLPTSMPVMRLPGLLRVHCMWRMLPWPT